MTDKQQILKFEKLGLLTQRAIFPLKSSILWRFFTCAVCFKDILDALHPSQMRTGSGEAAAGGSVEVATFCHRVNACDSESPIWLTSSGEAGGQAGAYLPKQPGLHHPSHCKNCHDSTISRRENERVATGRERRENREVKIWKVLGGAGESLDLVSCKKGAVCRESKKIQVEDRLNVCRGGRGLDYMNKTFYHSICHFGYHF